MIRIASIDIGVKNCAFYIEEFDRDVLSAMKEVKNRYRILDHTPTDEFKTLLHDVYKIGKTIFLEKVDLNPKNNKENHQIFLNLTKYLDSHLDLWDQCSIFLIERQ